MGTIRILLVMDYAFSYLGGAQTAVEQQALALSGAGHAVTVVAPDASTAPSLTGTDVALRDIDQVLPFSLLGLPLVRNGTRTRTALGELMDAGVDLVITHSEYGLAAAALQVARGRGIPAVHTVHTFFITGPAWGAVLCPPTRLVHRVLTRLPDPGVRLAPRRLDSVLRGMTLAICREADLVLSPSHHQAAALRAAGLPEVVALSNTSCAMRERAAPRPSTGALRLVWAARFAPEKRLDVALRAMRIVEDLLGPGAVHLDVAGGRLGGDDVPSGVTVHGRIPTRDVVKLIRLADAALITSHGFDNQPMIAIEAFAAGRPVVVSDPVLAAEFGGAAIAADSPTAEGLAATIAGLAGDRRRVEEASRAAVLLAEGAAPAAHARRIEEVHASLRDRVRSARP